MPYHVSKTLVGPFLRLLWRPEVTGAEHVPATGAAILASNHLSILDSVFLPLVLERPVTFVAKSEYFTGTRPIDRLTARYLRSTRQVPVDRTSARAGLAMLEAALDLLRAGELFGIYPEGTRSPDGRLYRAKTGVAYLAMTAEVPVLPVAMVGTDRVLPPGRTVPRIGRVAVRIGAPLTFTDYAGRANEPRARRAVADEVMRAIQALSGQQYVGAYAPARKTTRSDQDAA